MPSITVLGIDTPQLKQRDAADIDSLQMEQ
jgi:hypothetical protein